MFSILLQGHGGDGTEHNGLRACLNGAAEYAGQRKACFVDHLMRMIDDLGATNRAVRDRKRGACSRENSQSVKSSAYGPGFAISHPPSPRPSCALRSEQALQLTSPAYQTNPVPGRWYHERVIFWAEAALAVPLIA